MPSGHGFAVAEARRVVVRKHAEHRRAERRRPEHLRARVRHDFRVFLAHPVFVRQVHQQRHARLHRGHHRARAHGMHLHHHAGLLRFVDHRAKHFQFLLARAGHRRQRDFAGELDALRGHRADCRAAFVGCASQVDALGGNDARSVDHAAVDVVSQRDVAVAGPAARENRRVAGLELRLHLRFFHRARY